MIKEEIFRFEISVNDAVLMNVLDTGEDLLHKLDGFGLIEAFSFDDVIEKFTAFSILHDEVDVGFCFDNFVELDDVGMAEDFEDANFASDAFDIGLFDNFLFLKGFDGDFFLSEDVGAKFDFTESAFADGGADSVVAENDFALGSGGHGMFELLSSSLYYLMSQFRLLM